MKLRVSVFARHDASNPHQIRKIFQKLQIILTINIYFSVYNFYKFRKMKFTIQKLNLFTFLNKIMSAPRAVAQNIYIYPHFRNRAHIGRGLSKCQIFTCASDAFAVQLSVTLCLVLSNIVQKSESLRIVLNTPHSLLNRAHIRFGP